MIFQVGFPSRCGAGCTQTLSRDAASRGVQGPSAGSFPLWGRIAACAPSLFPDTLAYRGLGASVGATAAPGDLPAAVWWGTQLLGASRPDSQAAVSPQAGRGAGSFPFRPHGWGHSSAAPERAQSREPTV